MGKAGTVAAQSVASLPRGLRKLGDDYGETPFTVKVEFKARRKLRRGNTNKSLKAA